MRIDLGGKTALVTGAATPIGRAIAEALAGAGARVAVHHLTQARDACEVVRSIVERGRTAFAVEADVTRRAGVDAMVKEVALRLGGLDVLVNNPGVSPLDPLVDLGEGEWDRVLVTELKSVFLCTHAVVPFMQETGRGAIVNVASELGHFGGARFAAYASARCGVLALTRSLGREFAPDIRVNAIAPAPAASAPTGSPLEIDPEGRGPTDFPARRSGLREEIAATAVFLASDLASVHYGDVLPPAAGPIPQ